MPFFSYAFPISGQVSDPYQVTPPLTPRDLSCMYVPLPSPLRSVQRSVGSVPAEPGERLPPAADVHPHHHDRGHLVGVLLAGADGHSGAVSRESGERGRQESQGLRYRVAPDGSPGQPWGRGGKWGGQEGGRREVGARP